MKSKVRVGAPKASKFNFDKKVVGTTDFGTLTALECKLVLPGDKLDVGINQFTYLMPMPKPTFGKIDTINRAFFVPIRVLMTDWKEFITNQRKPFIASGGTIGSLAPTVPNTTIHQLSYAFKSLCSVDSDYSGGQLGRIDSTEPSNYDYVYIEALNSTVTRKYITLSFMGRKLLAVFHGLGLNFPFVEVGSSRVSDEVKKLGALADKRISLLPLLAWAHIYYEWFIPARFLSKHRNLKVAMDDIGRGMTGINSTGAYRDDTTHIVTASLLIGLFKLYSSFLSDDYFTSAFISPYGYEDMVNVSSSTIVQNLNYEFLDDSDFDNSSVSTAAPEPSSGAGTFNNATYIQALTLKSIGRLQDMVNRGKVAGNKIQDFLKVTYGIKPSDSVLDISTYLGSNRKTIKIGPVMSNADTEAQGGATLGQFAGRGLTNDLEEYGHFSYEAQEHGIFIITNEIQVRSSYWQGLRPEFDLLNREDFCLPELDALGVEAVPAYQLMFSDLEGSDASVLQNVESEISGFDHILSFRPTYDKYKFNFDSLLGDFRYKTKNTGLDSWYLSRLFDFAENYEIDENFLLMTSRNASSQYDHIFQVADNSADHFYSVFNLNFTMYRHLIPTSESLDYTDGSGTVSVDMQSSINN